MAHHPSAQPLDQLDPHHELPHHGHVIIRPSTLVAVLAALLVFTIMTVAASRAEVWAAHAFHIEIPQLVNVLIALSIAVVKSILVAMFFMQLKYDNPLNTIIFLFCLFAFALFLFFSMTDLGTRAQIYAYKSGEIKSGGLGIDTTKKDKNGTVTSGVNTGTDGIVAFARKRRIEQIGQLNAEGKLNPPLAPGELPEARWEKEYRVLHHIEDEGDKAAVSDASHSRVAAPGQTPGLYSDAPAATHEGGHGH